MYGDTQPCGFPICGDDVPLVRLSNTSSYGVADTHILRREKFVDEEPTCWGIDRDEGCWIDPIERVPLGCENSYSVSVVQPTS